MEKLMFDVDVQKYTWLVDKKIKKWDWEQDINSSVTCTIRWTSINSYIYSSAKCGGCINYLKTYLDNRNGVVIIIKQFTIKKEDKLFTSYHT